MSKRQPRWGSLLYHADYDFVSFGLLFSSSLVVEAFYHSTQAIEKYLKVLSLSIYDPYESKTTNEWIKFLKSLGHDLDKLGQYCSASFPYFAKKNVIDNLKRFSEFDQAARYPWVKQTLGNGFSSADYKIVYELVKELRTSIPIQIDDYQPVDKVKDH